MEPPTSPTAPPAAPLGSMRRVAVTAILGMAVVALAVSAGDDMERSGRIAIGFGFYVVAALAVVLEAQRVGAPLPPIPDRPVTAAVLARLIALCVVGLATVVPMLYLAVIVVSWFFPEWVTANFLTPEPDEEFSGGILSRALFAVEAVALAPVVEELVFRGAMLHWWAPRWGLRRATIVSAALFCILHLDPLGSFTFAIMATALYLAAGTMLMPIVLHAAWNCTVTILAAAASGDPGEQGTVAQLREGWHWWLALWIPSLATLILLVRRLRPPTGWTLPAHADRAA